ncbi:MAG: DNA/RNA non-specific endonuclease [Pyrinomonadaceae bacterium]
MKRFFYTSLFCLCAFAVWCAASFQTAAQSETSQSPDAEQVSASLVISQFQTAGATANDEFIEFHNISSTAIDLNGYRLVYRSAGGTNDVPFINWTTGTIVPAGGYYLIASTGYDDSITPDIIYNPTTCACSMSASGGGLAIRSGSVNSGAVFDSVGYGTATNAFIETAVASAPAANAGQARLNNGCQDTDNNANDFSALNPSLPRNASNSPNVCGSGGSSFGIGVGVSPFMVAPGGMTLITVSISSANPPSTGVSVIGNFSSIGGATNQQFYDDGTHGDATAGDNVFSFSAAIPETLAGGTYGVPINASDAQMRTAAAVVNIIVNAPGDVEDPLLLGNPTNATADVNQPSNYLMVKPQYTLSYNRDKGEPNWVAWRLDSTWIGNASRQDDYRPDPALPAEWYHVQPSDYSGSGYDRGHMCPSGDRTRSVADNSATFLLTNFLPQLAANNQGPWNDFENYCRSLAQTGNELYIVSGGAGNAGTIANGHVVVPQVTWKVVVVLPNGTNDLQRVTKATRTIAIIVPNQPPLNGTPWRNYRVSVDAVEALTGYNFFSNVPKNTQELIERRKDRQ